MEKIIEGLVMFSTEHLHPTNEVSLPAVKWFWLIKHPWAVWQLLQWEGCCSWRGSCCQTQKRKESGRIIGPWSSGMMVLEKQSRNWKKKKILAFITRRVWRKKNCFPPTKSGVLVAEFVSMVRKCSCNPAEQSAWHGKKCQKRDTCGTALHSQHRVVVMKSPQADASLYMFAFLFYK